MVDCSFVFLHLFPRLLFIGSEWIKIRIPFNILFSVCTGYLLNHSLRYSILGFYSFFCVTFVSSFPKFFNPTPNKKHRKIEFRKLNDQNHTYTSVADRFFRWFTVRSLVGLAFVRCTMYPLYDYVSSLFLSNLMCWNWSRDRND